MLGEVGVVFAFVRGGTVGTVGGVGGHDGDFLWLKIEEWRYVLLLECENGGEELESGKEVPI